MSEAEEKIWQAGRSAAFVSIVENVTSQLPRGKAEQAALLTERQRAIVALRELCAKFGDNDWPDDLYLADIIEKHLGRHLWSQ